MRELDRIFEDVQQRSVTQPLLSADELSNILDRTPGAAPSGRSRVLTPGIILTGLLSIAALVTIAVLSTSSRMEVPVTSVPKKVETTTTGQSAERMTVVPETTLPTPVRNTTPVQASGVIRINNSFSKLREFKRHDRSPDSTRFFIELSTEQLNKLMVLKSDTSVTIYGFRQIYPGSKQDADLLKSQGYDPTNIGGNILEKTTLNTSSDELITLDFNARQMATLKQISPVYAARLYSNTAFGSNDRGFSRMGRNMDLVDAEARSALSNEIVSVLRNADGNMRIQGGTGTVLTQLNRTHYARHLVPVKINISQGNVRSTVILFYLPNRAFLSALPESIAGRVRQVYGETENLMFDVDRIPQSDPARQVGKIDSSIAGNTQKPHRSTPDAILSQQTQKIKGVSTLAVSDDDAERLGIRVDRTKSTITFASELKITTSRLNDKQEQALLGRGIDITRRSLLLRTKKAIQVRADGIGQIAENDMTVEYDSTKYFRNAVESVLMYTLERVDTGYVEVSSTVYTGYASPAFHTVVEPTLSEAQRETLERALHKQSVEQAAMNQLNIQLGRAYRKLIPVEFTLGDSASVQNGNRYIRVILWFVPTPEFISMLPEGYCTRLTDELDAASRIGGLDAPPEEACNAIEGESILDLCRAQSSNIRNMKLMPNVAARESQCVFELVRDMNIRVTIHNLNGVFVKSCLQETKFRKGVNSVRLDLEGLKEGYYLVAITSAGGEQTVQRLVVQ